MSRPSDEKVRQPRSGRPEPSDDPPALVRDRVLAMFGAPEYGRRLSPELIAAIGALDLWIWGDLHGEELEAWRRLAFEPATAVPALEDLLVCAALARDWHAVATAAIAVRAATSRGRHAGAICAAAVAAAKRAENLGKWTNLGLAQRERDAWASLAQTNDAPAPTDEERRALVACVRAWDARAERMQRAAVSDALAERRGPGPGRGRRGP